MTLKGLGTQISAPNEANTSTAVAPLAELRSELPWYRREGVFKRKKLVSGLIHRTCEGFFWDGLERAAADKLAEKIRLQMEADAVMVAHLIGIQLSARVAQAQFAYQKHHMDIFKNQLRLRYEFLALLETLAKAGGISTPQELADAKQCIYGFIQKLQEHNSNIANEELLALKAHADKTFSHIARMNQN